ncbi:MAG: RtcB family protein [bacterium]
MLESFNLNRWKIHRTDGMNVEPIVYANDEIKPQLEHESLQQLVNASKLRGVEYIGGMPDLHVGYGVPVGCVMAMNLEDGLISSGAVGMDINCGMRLMGSGVSASDVPDHEMKSLARQISKTIPLGIGTESRHQDELEEHIEDILLEGVPTLEKLGYARKDDLDRIQDGGSFDGANLSGITDDAWNRLDQLSTLGGGNHFIEIDAVGEIYDPEAAEAYGLQDGHLTVTIHTGSRGFGHQICTDYSDMMLERADDYGLDFRDNNLAAAPINSALGEDYYGAMAAAANLAYSNRQMIGYDIRKVFQNLLGLKEEEGLRTVYDITHNLARQETIGDQQVLTHRKGAIRGLPAGHPDNPDAFESVGHPIIVPGNMGRGSYVLKATPAVSESWYTVNHGAGRVMSRRQANDSFNKSVFSETMEDIILLGAAHEDLLDEAPPAYKALDAVVDTLTEIGLVEKVAHLQPEAVIKGG